MDGTNRRIEEELWTQGDEVPEADAQEQQQDARGGGAEDEPDPEAPVAQQLSGRDLDVALSSANEADLAEQASEVPFDDDDFDQ
jgi:hypothetical protein